MQHRQQMPFQWVMPQRQQIPYQWANQPRPMRQMPMNQPRSYSMMGMPPQPRQSGGLLAKLLGKRNPTSQGGLFGMNSVPMGAPASKGSILQSLGDPNYINGLLTNTQQVLKAAQQITPMVQQYGPLVRNIPAMWKLFRGLKEASDEKEETTENQFDDIDIDIDVVEEELEDLPNKNKRTNADNSARKSRIKKGKSMPKLYI